MTTDKPDYGAAQRAMTNFQGRTYISEHEALMSFAHAMVDHHQAIGSALQIAAMMEKFQIGDRARKVKGSSWQGRVVGFYSASLTPEGYAVESEREPGSVQIYPAAALTKIEEEI